jgi:hypothetical protein
MNSFSIRKISQKKKGYEQARELDDNAIPVKHEARDLLLFLQFCSGSIGSSQMAHKMKARTATHGESQAHNNIIMPCDGQVIYLKNRTEKESPDGSRELNCYHPATVVG